MVYLLVCLKGGETPETSNCPDPVEAENFQGEMAREASNCLPGSTQRGAATNRTQQSNVSSLPTAMNMPGLASSPTSRN